ncbi:unnamed protein product [Bursaphelenchus okinawaensis]|uniref:DOMON domain-containing protein n=1 Tax=Bursaphelenchus okinawaensis TaxID=465554 RepID=A0A811KQW2_9BILA|nr:unnamed protein product [Bursaphelenchus okinawaensis]CAG9108270.1 unnamed protein product [Bursaphelenchus okinawaensis]
MKPFFVFLSIFVAHVLSQSQSCSFVDEDKGYSLAWSAGIGFVDFILRQKEFPSRSAHWTGVGFGNKTIQLALVERQYDKVIVSSAGLYGPQPPLKIPTANMVTRGSGDIVNGELVVTFSIPNYYFSGCSDWWFFTSPTQVGMPYSDEPKKRLICDVIEVCRSSSSIQEFPRGKRQTNIDLNSLLNNPIHANIDFSGGVQSSTNGQFNVNYNPYDTQSSGASAQLYNPPYTSGYSSSKMYGNNYGNTANGYSSTANGYSNPSMYDNGYSSSSMYGNQYSNSAQTSNGYSNPSGNYFDTRYPQSSQSNLSSPSVENPNYKFLPEGYNNVYEQNQQRFFDPQNSQYGNQYATTTTMPVLSNDEQNKKNYQDIQGSGVNNQNQRYTNNIYGYDYRSNPGTRYTINGDESMYQPPEVSTIGYGKKKREADSLPQTTNSDQNPSPSQTSSNQNSKTSGNLKGMPDQKPTSRARRQSAYAGTAYNNQDLKFPREENTIPMSAQFDAFGSSAFYDDNSNINSNNNMNSGSSMYYPYRTDTNSNLGQSGQDGNTGPYYYDHVNKQSYNDYASTSNGDAYGSQLYDSSSYSSQNGYSNQNPYSNPYGQTAYGSSAQTAYGSSAQTAYGSNAQSPYSNTQPMYEQSSYSNAYGTNTQNSYSNPNSQQTQLKEQYDTQNGITSVKYTSTNGGNVRLYDPKNDPTVTFTDNSGYETKPIDVIRQYDTSQCSGADPYWCRDYVKTYMKGAGSGTSVTQSACTGLRQSLLHSDHHCCQAVQQAGCQ